MLNLKNSVRAILALGLLAAVPAMAQSAYTNGTPVQIGSTVTVPLALGPTGQLAVGTPVELYSDGSYSNAEIANVNGVSLPWVNNYVGNSASTLTSFGPTQTVNQTYGFIVGAPNGYASAGYSSSFNVVAIGANGIASNANNLNGDEDEGASGVGFTGVVTNTNTGAIHYTGSGTLVTGINSSNAVSGTLYAGAGGYYSNPAYTGSTTNLAYGQYSATNVGPTLASGVSSTPFYEAATSATEVSAYGGAVGNLTIGTPTALATLGYGGVGTGINTLGQVVGADYVAAATQTCYGPYYCFSTPANTEAFITGNNGGAVHYLGTGNGVASYATSVNNAGEVGGYITLASGQTEGFISTPTYLLVAATPGAATDSTAVEFLNASGQAIIDDSTTNTWYLDTNGNMVTVNSLFSAGALTGETIDAVVGFDNSGQILLQVSNTATGDPGLLVDPTGAALPTGTNVTSTQGYTDVAASQGGQTPDASFFTAITGDADLPGDTGGSTGGTGGSSVPAPLSTGLLGFGLLLVGALRRRKAASGVVGV